MLRLVSSLIGAAGAVGLIITAFIFMLSSEQGGAVLKRVVIFLVGALIGTCLLRQFAASVHFGPSFLLLAVTTSVVAFVIREVRRSHAPRQGGSQHRGAERTPVMPSHFDNEEDL